MDIHLTPEHEKFIAEGVAAGEYIVPSEVVRHALELLQELHERREAKLAALREKIDVGLKQIERGEYSEFDDAALERILTEGRKRLDERRGRTADDQTPEQRQKKAS